LRNRFYLPPSSSRKEVAAALKYHNDSNLAEYQQRAVEWTRAHWFVQGVRNLKILLPNSGGVPTPTFVDSTGQRRVRIELAVQMMQTEIGRILGIDLSPGVVRSPGIGLDSVRGTAISQTVLDDFWTRYDTHEFRLALAAGLVTYGTMGVTAFDVESGHGGIFGGSLALIPPWELMPLPSGITGIDQVSGIGPALSGVAGCHTTGSSRTSKSSLACPATRTSFT
jgi:hypothetical protein